MEPSPEERGFAAALVEAHDLIVEAARNATEPGVVEIELPAVAEVPKQWQTTLLRWAVETGIGPGRDRKQADRFRAGLRLLTMIVTGHLERLHLMVNETSRHERQPDGTVREWNPLHHFVVGSWKTRLPDVPVLCLDATADAAGLRAATGRDVHDCTPSGHLPNIAPVVQIPWDVTAGQSPKTAAGLIEAMMTSHPEIERWGLLGHQDHIRAMMDDDDVLPARLRAKVTKACWYGAGPDRASNRWHDECDGMILVGTLRPGGGPVRERLVVRGQCDAARRSGDWGVRHWKATTTDGREIVVEGKGYRDPEWHAAHVAISRAAVQQGAGRGRAITETGIPVWIISDEPMGVPVDDSLEPVTPVVRQVVEAVTAIRDGGAGTELFPIRESYRKMFGSRVGVRVSAVAEYLRATAGKMGKKLGQRAIEKRLRLAVAHGRLLRATRGWVCLTDDVPAALDALQVSPPAPAMVSRTEPAVVISTTGPRATEPPIDVAAETSSEAVTTITTTTAQPADDLPPDDGLHEVEERAALLEFDGGFDRETADRLAHEMVMGRGDSRPVSPPEPVGVDHVALAARMRPLVSAALSRFGGTVRVISDKEAPFPPRHPPPAKNAVCRCGSLEWSDVPIHEGRSRRRECAGCGKFIEFAVWYGRRLVGLEPDDDDLPVAFPSTAALAPGSLPVPVG
jgi:hypothetical protein